MQSQELSNLEIRHRLIRLERRNQILSLGCVVLFAAFACLFWLGASPPKDKTVYAGRFILVDEKGKERATLGVHEEGHASLDLRDETGTKTAFLSDAGLLTLNGGFGKQALSLWPGAIRFQDGNGKLSFIIHNRGESDYGPLIHFHNPKGEEVLKIESVKEGPSIVFLDPSGLKPIVVIEGSKDSSRISIFDPNTKSKRGIGLSTGEHSIIGMLDGNGHGRTSLSLYHDRPSLEMWDSNHKKRIQLSLSKADGAPSLSLADEKENIRATLGSTSLVKTVTGDVETRAPSSLVLFDRQGKVLFKAP